jgi:hypothetical protein
VFAEGDYPFHGPAGNLALTGPVVAAAAQPDGSGYWLFGADGGTFTYDAPFYGAANGA